jgi:hypothetical protein
MDALLRVIPKNMLAFLAIAGGILFWVVIYDPPHTVCDSQLEAVKKTQAKFLYKDPKAKKINTTRYQTLYDNCKVTNQPGGCYELFREMKRLLEDLSNLSRECGAELGAVAEHKKALWDVMDLLLRIAWGTQPPGAYHAKFGWLDTADISLFCSLKNRITTFYGELAWSTFREKMMKELPGAKDLAREQVWDLSLFSENCSRYP